MSDKPYNEPKVLVHELLEQSGAVTPAVVDVYAALFRFGADRVDDGFHLVVLTLEVRRFARPKPESQRRHFPGPAFARHRHAATVAELVSDLALASVPDLGQILHLLGIVLLDVGRVDDDERVLADFRRRIVQKAVVQGLVHALPRQIPAQAVFHLGKGNLFVQFPSDLAQFHVLCGLYAVKHLLDETSFRLGKTGRKYP